jgi:HEAT repeat protein
MKQAALPELAKLLRSKDIEEAHHASHLIRFFMYGPGCNDLDRAIFDCLKSPDDFLRTDAIIIVAQNPHMTDGVAVLIGAVDDPMWKEDQYTVASALELMGPIASPALPKLRAMFDPKTQAPTEKRKTFYEAFATVGRDDEPSVAIMRALLVDPNQSAGLRTAMAQSLGKSRFGKRAHDDLTSVIKKPLFGSHPDPRLRLEAINALIRIGPSENAVDVLIESLADRSNDRHREESLVAIGRIGRKAGKAVPALLELLTEKDFEEDFGDDEYCDAMIRVLGRDEAAAAVQRNFTGVRWLDSRKRRIAIEILSTPNE